MDFDFDNFIFLDFFGSQISRFPVPRFPNFQKSGLGPGLGPGWGAGFGPGLGRGPGRGPIVDSKVVRPASSFVG